MYLAYGNILAGPAYRFDIISINWQCVNNNLLSKQERMQNNYWYVPNVFLYEYMSHELDAIFSNRNLHKYAIRQFRDKVATNTAKYIYKLKDRTHDSRMKKFRVRAIVALQY